MDSPYSPVCALGTSPQGGSKTPTIPRLPPPSGGIAASRCQWQKKRSRNFRSGRKTQANECAQRFSGTARRRCQRRVTPAADGRGSPVGSDPQIAPPTSTRVRQADRRGRRPLRSGRRFPRRGGAKCPLGYAPPADQRPRPTNGRGKPRPYAANGQAGGQAPPLRSEPTSGRVLPAPTQRTEVSPERKKAPSDKGQRGRVRVFRRSSSAFR